jgi:hypothetical protein
MAGAANGDVNMRKPKNINNYSECVRWENSHLYIYCVECNNWLEVMIECTAQVTYKQSSQNGKISICRNLIYLCGQCYTDIGYLLSEKDRNSLIERIDILI